MLIIKLLLIKNKSLNILLLQAKLRLMSLMWEPWHIPVYTQSLNILQILGSNPFDVRYYL